MTNTHLSGCHTCLLVDTPHKCSIHVLHIAVFDSTRFLDAPRLKADISVVIDSSSIVVTNDVFEFGVESTTAQVTVEFVDSRCTSANSRILRLWTWSSNTVLTYVNVTAFASSFQSHDEVFYIFPCDYAGGMCPSHMVFHIACSIC